MKQAAGRNPGRHASPKRWIAENEAGRPNLQGDRAARNRIHPLEQVGAKLRAMMPFLQPIIAPGLEAKPPPPRNKSIVGISWY